MSDLMSRIAGAPITWGVDGSPGWGHLMDVNRVLSEMEEVGLHATELGPGGYLPSDPEGLYFTTEYDGLWVTSNLSADRPSFRQVESYNFAHPMRVQFNPYRPTEM